MCLLQDVNLSVRADLSDGKLRESVEKLKKSHSATRRSGDLEILTGPQRTLCIAYELRQCAGSVRTFESVGGFRRRCEQVHQVGSYLSGDLKVALKHPRLISLRAI